MNVLIIDATIKAYRSKIELESYPELTCGLCSQIMINPCATPCGCNYCKTCIEAYLDDNHLYCPGSNEDCKVECLVRSRDIHYDPRAHRMIGKILVKCLNENCDYRVELIKMNAHMEVCDKVYRDCPFLEIGCNDGEILLSDMGNHLSQQSYIHSNILVKCLNEVRSEIRAMKADYEDRLRVQKEETDAVRLELESTKIQMNDHRIFFEGEILKQREELMTLKEAVSRLETKTIEVTESGDAISPEEDIGALANLNQLKSKEGSRKEFRISVDKVLNSHKENMESFEMINLRILKLEDVNEDIKDSLEMLDEKISRKIDLLRYGDYIWRIDNFSKTMADAVSGIAEFIWSECFYSHYHGYKLRLLLFPNGFNENKNKYMEIYFVLMKGEYDDLLQWPCRRRFVISLLDQENAGRSEKSIFSRSTVEDEMKSRFDRVSTDRSQYLGRSLVSLEDLRRVPAYSLGDKVFISGIVK